MYLFFFDCQSPRLTINVNVVKIVNGHGCKPIVQIFMYHALTAHAHGWNCI